MTYSAVVDDDLTRITHIKYCLSNNKGGGVYGNFMGFEVTVDSPTSGISKLSYASMSDTGAADFTCFNDVMGTEELMQL